MVRPRKTSTDEFTPYVAAWGAEDDTAPRCPRCKGTGMDRWEEDECQTCFGEGSLPIPGSTF